MPEYRRRDRRGAPAAAVRRGSVLHGADENRASQVRYRAQAGAAAVAAGAAGIRDESNRRGVGIGFDDLDRRIRALLCQAPCPPATADYPLAPDDVFRLDTPGGGGFGDPLEQAERVLADVREGMFSREAAEKDYGVVVTEAEHGFVVDAAATTRKRNKE